MKSFTKKHLTPVKEDQETMRDDSEISKPSTEYIINQTIIWIVIVFLAVIIVKKFF